MRGEKQEEKRSSILEAAASIFSNKGYPNTKMQDIAEKAGIGKGTIYQYFKSKKHLFRQVIKEGMNFYLNGIKNEIKGYSDLKEILKVIVKFSFSFMEKHGHVLRMIASHRSIVDENTMKWIYDRKTKVISLISKIIAENTEKTPQNVNDINLAAYCFFGMMISVIQEKVFHNREFDIEEVSEKIVNIFLRGYDKI
ncbi:MAG: TetR/AcrR family transcriptional regulator [Thermovenabulum sp.]|uniref:TetR/AcrR family transcriptional regulator n=1 Tax=Thermovenabulum sp. TaxID=3100335 RepID=UPI003C7DE5AF